MTKRKRNREDAVTRRHLAGMNKALEASKDLADFPFNEGYEEYMDAIKDEGLRAKVERAVERLHKAWS